MTLSKKLIMQKFQDVELLESRCLFSFGNVTTSWSANGRTITAFDDSESRINCVVEANGKIYAAGQQGVVRYAASGAIDNSFSGDGILPFSDFTPMDLKVDSGGNVFLLGDGLSGPTVRKYTSTGMLASTFGSGGDAVLSGANFQPRKLLLQTDGKILIGGNTSGNGLDSQIRLYRLKTNGKPDTGFHSSGNITFQLGTVETDKTRIADNFAGLNQLVSGEIVVAGSSFAYRAPANPQSSLDYLNSEFGSGVLGIARLTTAGEIDSTFSSAGYFRKTLETGSQLSRYFRENIQQAVYSAVASISTSGTMTVVAKGELLSATQLAANGNVNWSSQTEPGFPAAYVAQIVRLNDERFVVMGTPDSANAGHGPVLVGISSTGDIRNWIKTDDLKSATADLRDSAVALIAPSGGGVVAGGQPNSSNGYMLERFSAGSASDPRPDEFKDGQSNDLVRDASGALHVAFFDAGVKRLKYARRLVNGQWDATVTVDSGINSGIFVSLSINSLDQPSIAYFDGNAGNLRYAKSADNGKTWASELVESKGSTGLYPSLILGASDGATIAYYNKSNGDLKIASKKPDNSWGFTTVDSVGDVGRNASLTQNPDTGQFVVAYSSTTQATVKCAFYLGQGKWNTVVAATTTGGVDFISAGYAGDFRPAIAYYDAQTADLGFAFLPPLNKWNVSSIATKKVVGLYNSLVFDDGVPWIYAFSRSTQSASLYDTNNPNDVRTAILGGGKYLSVFSEAGLADMAFADDVESVLKVRNGPNPYTGS